GTIQAGRSKFRPDKGLKAGVFKMAGVFRVRARLAVLTVLTLMLLCSACSSASQASVDPANVDVTVFTDPSPAPKDKAVKLTGAFTGIELDKSATVSIEVRNGDQSEFVDAEYAGNNSFEAEYTFKRSGINEVFVHLYSG